MQRYLLLMLGLLAVPAVQAADPAPVRIEFNTVRITGLGIRLAECEKPVYQINITANLNDKDEGRGDLLFDQTEPPTYDEFGFVVKSARSQETKLECHVKHVKTTTHIYRSRVGGPSSIETQEYRDVWKLYSITGPRITSPLFVALPVKAQYPPGRFLVRNPDGKVKHLLDLTLPPQPEPCHPGCFPAGTAVRVPGGTTPIENILVGDLVTTFNLQGLLTSGKVTAVFVTRNRLLEVRTKSGTLVTTQTQPLSLEAGGYRSASELKKGDQIYRWDGSKRRAEAVLEVSPLLGDSKVFNLILGEPTTFIASDFLVRSKPPADVVLP